VPVIKLVDDYAILSGRRHVATRAVELIFLTGQTAYLRYPRERGGGGYSAPVAPAAIEISPRAGRGQEPAKKMED
jgi:hypothetical protein